MRYLLFLLCVHFVHCSFAQDCGGISDCNQKGDKYFEDREYERAYDCYLKNISRNDAYAQLQIGRMILDDKIDYGLEKKEALNQLERSAESGNVKAMELLGDCYFKGITATANIQKAATWYEKADKNGSGYAAYVMGTFYDYEGKLKKDLSTAQRYYYKAADRGNILAAERLKLLNTRNNILLPGTSGKELPGGQFNLQAGNLKTQWYYTQSVFFEKPVIRDDETVSEETYYLNKDYNYDGIPDLGKTWYFKSNAWNSAAPSQLLLFTTKFDKFKGGEVQLFIEDPATILVVKDSAARDLTDISEMNGFYRYSKVITGGATVRTFSSLPFLLQAPQNYKEKKETVIYLKYITRIAAYNGCSSDGSKSDYFMATVDGPKDFEIIKDDKKFWLDIHCDGSTVPYLLNASDGNTLATNKVNWGKEKVYSVAWLKVKLIW